VSHTLLFEIGVEEIPSAHLYGVLPRLEREARKRLDDVRLGFGEISVYASPRRLALVVSEVAETQEDRNEEVRGPSVEHAFDAEGDPTRAAEGFARSRGVDVSTLVTRECDGGEYVFAVINEEGRDAIEVLGRLLADLVGSIDWPKSMRWGSGDTRFSRPVRWLTALLGAEVIPVGFAGLVAGDTSRGHRFLSNGPVKIPTADRYLQALESAYVVVDQERRATIIRQGIEESMDRMDTSAVVPEKVFAEVVNLVEWPTVGVGRFDEEFLQVPREVLETAMESHQRYFPVEDASGSLSPTFVVVHNGAPDLTKEIVSGHERVIRARLADAAFFWEEDRKEPLEDHVSRLETIIFQERLGTVAQRVDRIEALTSALAQQLGVGAEVTKWATRAAHLCKADLACGMVAEFPTLQGVMGRHYAVCSGEAPQVADAILEHYQPRFAGDVIPTSEAGAIVSVADKLDTIVGIFGIGMTPTGSADPYALRRGALGILGIAVGRGWNLRLDDAITSALDGYKGAIKDLDREATRTAVKEFVLGRMETVLKDDGHAYDTVAAILAVAGDDPSDAIARARALTAVRDQIAIEDLSVAYTRAKNLSDHSLGAEADPGLMNVQEKALMKALEQAEARVANASDRADYPTLLDVLSQLRGPIDDFFDAVLVMDEDERLRENRLRLLNRFVAVFSRFADIGKLVE